ncbi:MAG: hypothetical protein NZM04_09705 [Methylacidiphilales bacterium]|nr:hypothetical protein [Candidatus Methylacidiphilales bacterium]
MKKPSILSILGVFVILLLSACEQTTSIRKPVLASEANRIKTQSNPINTVCNGIPLGHSINVSSYVISPYLVGPYKFGPYERINIEKENNSIRWISDSTILLQMHCTKDGIRMGDDIWFIKYNKDEVWPSLPIYTFLVADRLNCKTVAINSEEIHVNCTNKGKITVSRYLYFTGVIYEIVYRDQEQYEILLYR